MRRPLGSVPWLAGSLFTWQLGCAQGIEGAPADMDAGGPPSGGGAGISGVGPGGNGAPGQSLPPPPYTGSGGDVMLQGFVWTRQDGWWTVVRDNAAAIKSAGFTMVWLPPPSASNDPQGYLPTQWNLLDSAFGTQAELSSALDALHAAGIKAIADIVINHRNGTHNWGDFTNPSFPDNNKAICANDEFFQGGNPGAAVSAADRGAADSGDGYAAARDLDHTNADVQAAVETWLARLKATGFDGWRYDFVKGFSPGYIALYNDASSPYFSVAENWPTPAFEPNSWNGLIGSWIADTGKKSPAFDFVTKPLLAQALPANHFGALSSGGKPAGLIGSNPAYAVTFLDNHNTAPAPGGQNMWPFPDGSVEQGYAYILTHPGVPCVFWPHYFDGGALATAIRNLIAIRKAAHISSTSSVEIVRADDSVYAAIINDNLALKLGSGSWSPGANWTIAQSGTNYTIWTAGTMGTGTGGCSGVPVTFTIANAETSFGQNLYVVGDLAALGGWAPASGFALGIEGAGANVPWTGTTTLPPNTAFQYKYLKQNPATGEVLWESNQATASGNRQQTTAGCNSKSEFNDGNFKN